MDVDLRKIRYFVAVADNLHFRRAAEDLHIAQPALSRSIGALERELGTQLFVRDKRSVILTSAGRQLLDDAVPLLAAADATRRRVRLSEPPNKPSPPRRRGPLERKPRLRCERSRAARTPARCHHQHGEVRIRI